MTTPLPPDADLATPGPWRTVDDAQGPCMVMHPTREGVAIATLTEVFRPVHGFHDDWCGDDAPVTIAERNANARLIAAAPDLVDEIVRLRSLLADAERLIVAHHASHPRQRKGAICQVCAGEHEAVQAIWRELHQPDEAQENARP
jgi:hypothetical protein